VGNLRYFAWLLRQGDRSSSRKLLFCWKGEMKGEENSGYFTSNDRIISQGSSLILGSLDQDLKQPTLKFHVAIKASILFSNLETSQFRKNDKSIAERKAADPIPGVPHICFSSLRQLGSSPTWLLPEWTRSYKRFQSKRVAKSSSTLPQPQGVPYLKPNLAPSSLPLPSLKPLTSR